MDVFPSAGEEEGREEKGEYSYRAICCSRSCILARFATFIGLGFGSEGCGVESFCHGVSTSFPRTYGVES